MHLCTHFLVLTFTPTLRQSHWSPYGSSVSRGIFSSQVATWLLAAFSFRSLLWGQSECEGQSQIGITRNFLWCQSPYLPWQHWATSPSSSFPPFSRSTLPTYQMWCFVYSTHHAFAISPLRSFKINLSLSKAHTIWLSNCISRNWSHMWPHTDMQVILNLLSLC